MDTFLDTLTRILCHCGDLSNHLRIYPNTHTQIYIYIYTYIYIYFMIKTIMIMIIMTNIS